MYVHLKVPTTGTDGPGRWVYFVTHWEFGYYQSGIFFQGIFFQEWMGGGGGSAESHTLDVSNV